MVLSQAQDQPIVLSLGGSLVVPKGGIDVAYLKEFNEFIRKKIGEGKKFFIVVGGGSTARQYIEAAKGVVGKISDWDLDWLGIHATHLNAHLVRTIFRDIAHPRIIENYEKKIERLTEPLVIAAGGEPGYSTDYDAVMLARDYGASLLINLSNITSVYDKDPKTHTDATPLHAINWSDFSKLVGSTWIPGANLPFDPVATKLAASLHLTVYVVGRDLENLDHVFSGHDFTGTVITP
jgi:uridylate kinase